MRIPAFTKSCAAALMALGAAAVIPVQAQDAPEVSAKETAAYAAVIQSHVNAYRARDMNAFIATFAPDAVVVANGIKAKGRQQIRDFYALNFAPDAPQIRINASYMTGGGRGARLYMETAYTFADGQEMCCSQTFYTVKNGLITRVDVTG